MVTRAERLSPAYARVEQLIAGDVAVILDGGNATERGREHAVLRLGGWLGKDDVERDRFGSGRTQALDEPGVHTGAAE